MTLTMLKVSLEIFIELQSYLSTTSFFFPFHTLKRSISPRKNIELSSEINRNFARARRSGQTIEHYERMVKLHACGIIKYAYTHTYLSVV
jgi:hypothetical protein